MAACASRCRAATTLRVVVGCGLGDDVEALRIAGFDAIGFDVAPSAIAWAQRRFPALAAASRSPTCSSCRRSLVGRFSFVFEAYTVQALPVEVRDAAIDAVASLVAPGGTLLVICERRATRTSTPAGSRGR